MAIMVAGCFWGESEHQYLWQHMLNRFGDPPGYLSGLIAWIALRRYPASLMMYGGGIAAIAAGRYKNLAAILNAPVQPQGEKSKSAAEQLNVAQVLRDTAEKLIPGKQDRHTPYSDHLFEVLREPLRTYVPTDTDYEDAFLWFEYILGIVIWQKDGSWAPIGRCRLEIVSHVHHGWTDQPISAARDGGRSSAVFERSNRLSGCKEAVR